MLKQVKVLRKIVREYKKVENEIFGLEWNYMRVRAKMASELLEEIDEIGYLRYSKYCEYLNEVICDMNKPISGTSMESVYNAASMSVLMEIQTIVKLEYEEIIERETRIHAQILEMGK